MATLEDPVPSPGPAGPFGTMAWLRATVSRFANGETHARRRAIVEHLLDGLEPRIVGTGPYAPVASLADALGAPAVAVDDVRTVAAAYHPGTDAPGADAALQRVIDELGADDEETTAQRVAILVQACEATAALIRGETLPVKSTKRLQDGEVVLVDLAGRPFGAGSRRCPGERLARAFAEALR